MFKRFRVALCVFVAVAGIAGPLWAADFGYEVGVDVVSQYLWRGIVFDDRTSVQPSLTLAAGIDSKTSLELNGWWNFALSDHGSKHWKDLAFEQDFTLSAVHALTDSVELSAGYAYFSNPRSDIEQGADSWQTDEVFAGIAWAGDDLGLEATLNRDIDKIRGWYLDLGATRAKTLGKLVFESGLHVGVASGMDPGDADEAAWFEDDGLVDASVSLGLLRDLGPHVEVGASVSYSRRFDHPPAGVDKGATWFGVSFTYSR